MFWCQVMATVVGGTVQLGVQAWMFTNIRDICSADQPDGFSCPSTTVFGTASIIWGVIGPARQFSHGQVYYGLVFFFLIGFLAPLITVRADCICLQPLLKPSLQQWLIQKKLRTRLLTYINWPVIFNGTGAMPPATPLNFVSWSIVGFIFNYVIRRRHFSWWTKYNCRPIFAACMTLLITFV